MSSHSYTVESDYADFLPGDYLEEYYSEIGDENRFLMDFHAWCSQAIAEDPGVAEIGLVLADIGAGPTIYQLISAAKLVEEIHVYEYSEANRERVEYWINNQDDVFWDPYFHEGLAWENHYLNGSETGLSITGQAVESRKAELREKLRRCSPCDLFDAAVVTGKNLPKSGYPIVSSSFCVEAISNDPDIFERALDGVVSLCAEQGYLVLTMVRNCNAYRSGDRYFPAYPVNEDSMKGTLEAKGFELVRIASVEAEPPDRGYEALFGILAKRLPGQGRGRSSGGS